MTTGKSIAVLALLVSLGSAASAQTPLPEEASGSLFGPGEADMVLELSGFWKAWAVSTFSFAFEPGGGFVAGTPQPFLFMQQPDLYARLLLPFGLFLEARLPASIEDTLFAVGWISEDRAFTVRAGNYGLSFPAYPLMPVSDGPSSSFGVAARLVAEGFGAFFALRYEQAERRTASWTGGASKEELHVGPAEFLSGRFFLVPGTHAGIVAVHVERKDGPLAGSDGKRYRRLEAHEYSFDPSTGWLALALRCDGAVAVADSDAPAEQLVTVAGVACRALVPDGGRLGDPVYDHRVLSRYPIPSFSPDDGVTRRAFVRNLLDGSVDADFACVIRGDGFVELRWTGSDDEWRSYAKNPFRQAMPWLYQADYGNEDPDDPRWAPSWNREIVVVETRPVGAMTIGERIVPGSLEVRVNGARILDYSFDPETGTLVLAFSPGAGDVVEASYLAASEARPSGSVVAAAAAAWNDGGSEAWIALGTRWAVPGIAWAQAGTDTSGFVALSGGASVAWEELRAGAIAAVSYRSSDTTGRYRIEAFSLEGACSLRPLPWSASAASGANFATERADTSLATAFPETARVETPHSLSVECGDLAASSGAYVLAKAIPAAPIGAYSGMEFYARSGSVVPFGAENPELELSLLDGGSVVASARIPLSALGGGWKRFTLDWSSMKVLSWPGGEAVAGATVSRDAFAFESRELRIGLSGMQSGRVDVALVDLVQSGASLSLAGRAFATWAGEETPGPFASLDLSLGLEDSLSLACRAIAGFNSPWLSFAAGAASSPSGLEGWHRLSLGLPETRFRLGEEFRSADDGAFVHRITASAGDASLFVAKVEWLARAGEDAAGAFLERLWRLSAEAADSFVAIAADLRQQGVFALEELAYPEAWTASLRAWIPESDPEVSSFVGSLRAGDESAPFALVAADALSTGGSASSRVEARIAFPAKIGDVLVGPWISLSSSAESAADSSGIDSLSGSLSLSLLSLVSLPCVMFLPWRPDLLSDPVSLASDLARSDQAGISFARELGSSALDLLLPIRAELSVRREVSVSSGTELDLVALRLGLRGAAVDVFGSLGSSPSGLPFETDEYAWNSLVEIILRPEGQSPGVRAAHDALARFGRSDGTLDLSAKLAWESGPEGQTWSARARCALALANATGWLRDLVSLLATASGDVIAGLPEALADGTGRTTDRFFLSFAFASGPGATGLLDVSEGWECRYSVAPVFLAYVSVTLGQSFDLDDGGAAFGFELSFGVSLSF